MSEDHNANGKKQLGRLACLRNTFIFSWKINYGKGALLFAIASSFIGCLKPYITVILSTYILDSLVSGTTISELVTITLVGVSTMFLADILQGFFEKEKMASWQFCLKNIDLEIGLRTMRMAYSDLESPKVNDMRTQIKNDAISGMGFQGFLWAFQSTVSTVFTLLISAVIMLPLIFGGNFFEGIQAVAFVSGMILVTVASTFVNVKFFDKKSMAFLDESANKRSYFSYFLWGGMDYKAGKDIRLYAASGLFKSYLDDAKDWHKNWLARNSRLSFGKGVAGGAVSGLIQMGAYLFTVLRATAGSITAGQVIMYAAAINGFVENVLNVSSKFRRMTLAAERHQRILDYLELSDKTKEQPSTAEVGKGGGDFEFHNVSFRYPGSEKYALRNFSYIFSAGKKTAIVGENGSGKTTIVKLLCRLYIPSEGKITLNGRDISEFEYNDYINIFSVVFQDFSLFSLPLGEVIASSTSYDSKKISLCLEKAGFTERAEKLSSHLDTPLFNDFEQGGVEISGGESQKIAIARALYRDSKFVVLDEPTAALDPISEFDIYTKFNMHTKDKSVIYISHRLASCKFCDEILVLHNGETVQHGRHEDIVNDIGSKYHELWTTQAQYYIDKDECRTFS